MPELTSHWFKLWNQAQAQPLVAFVQKTFTPLEFGAGQSTRPLFCLPELCCAAAGGEVERAGQVTAAWDTFYYAARWLDAVADGECPPAEQGARITLAGAWMATGFQILAELEQAGIEPSIAQMVRKDFSSTILRASAGQMQDLTCQRPSLEQAWQMAELKTGDTYALACRVGARLASAEPAVVERFGVFGLQLGMILQINDDLEGLRTGAAPSDLAQGKVTLPAAYALEVLPDLEKQQLWAYLQAAPTDANAEAQALRMILESGAFLYLVTEATLRSSQAKIELDEAALPGPAKDQLLAVLSLVVPTL